MASHQRCCGRRSGGPCFHPEGGAAAVVLLNTAAATNRGGGRCAPPFGSAGMWWQAAPLLGQPWQLASVACLVPSLQFTHSIGLVVGGMQNKMQLLATVCCVHPV